MSNQKNINNDIELLVGGQQAFPAILDEIRAAQHSIHICMFVWRDDDIGRTIAEELFEAADRGVKINIVKDRNGLFCEYSEEDQSSFFHKLLSPIEIFKINIMKILYQPELLFKPFSRKNEELLNKIKGHPNITVDSEEYRMDHSKYYIFDEKTIIMGGINIEDKENGADIHGTHYIDYMVKIKNEEAVQELHEKLKNGPGNGDSLFALNVPGYKESGIIQAYLKMIDDTSQELSIIMSYLMPIKEITDALKRALDRGVKIRLLIPEKANYLNDSNRYTAMVLYDYANKNGYDFRIYMSEKMTHIKAMISENTISIGSANLTGRSLWKQGELNLFTQNDDSDFARSVKENFETIFADSMQVKNTQQLKHSKLVVLMEKFEMS